jgi:hypothetical protein
MIIPSGFAQSNIRFTGAAVPLGAEITIGWELASFPGPTPAAVAEAIADAWSPTIHEVLVNTLILSEVYVKFGPNDVGPSGSAFRNIPGSDVASAVPPNTAALVRKNTSQGGRRGRGRMYVPGVPDPHVDGSGTISTVMLNLLQVGIDDFVAATFTAGLVGVVLHAPGASTTPAPSQIDTWAVQSTVATQRDRLRR